MPGRANDRFGRGSEASLRSAEIGRPTLMLSFLQTRAVSKCVRLLNFPALWDCL